MWGRMFNRGQSLTLWRTAPATEPIVSFNLTEDVVNDIAW